MIAAQRPEIRFVEPKSKSQQARAVLLRGRERLVHQRTELVDALRSVLYEHGYSFPIGIGQVKRIKALLDDKDNNLSALVHEDFVDFLVQIAEKSARIDTKTKKIKALSAETDTARRLQTMPGIGPLTALAIEAFATPMETFKCGRDFAAWLGRVSKVGQADIRRLLIIGAMTRLNWLGRETIQPGFWLGN